MKIVIDDKIPYIKGAFEPFADVLYVSGSKTTHQTVKNADAIITRTRTICNEQLLKGSKVKMIATATIGFDHIDTEYCESNGIEWTNAPGCNSWSVAQYILAALCKYTLSKNYELSKLTIGIVGVGNVGSKVAHLCNSIGMRVLLNDPPRKRIEQSNAFVDLETIQQQADIITFHTPLTFEGNDKTYHLANKDFFSNCKNNVLLINSARGEIMNTLHVLDALEKGILSDTIIDCWENEPDIDSVLLKKSFIATPHIAGYSKDGKANGTSMSVQAISRKFNLGIDNWECTNIEKPQSTTILLDGGGKTVEQVVCEAVLATYVIDNDSDSLKDNPKAFEKLRGDYPVRREFTVYTVNIRNASLQMIHVLKNFGFKIIES